MTMPSIWFYLWVAKNWSNKMSTTMTLGNSTIHKVELKYSPKLFFQLLSTLARVFWFPICVDRDRNIDPKNICYLDNGRVSISIKISHKPKFNITVWSNINQLHSQVQSMIQNCPHSKPIKTNISHKFVYTDLCIIMYLLTL